MRVECGPVQRRHRGSRATAFSAGAIAVVLSLVPISLPASTTAQQPGPGTEPLAAFASLIGSWQGMGTGFSTTLRYAWEIEGHVLGVSNEVRNAEGGSLARYRGAYAWDAGLQQIVFWVTSQSGEVHRGRAWWSEGVLWHQAEVSGGRIKAYASAVRPGRGGLEYFASYGATSVTPALLETAPIVYRPVSDGASVRGPAGP